MSILGKGHSEPEFLIVGGMEVATTRLSLYIFSMGKDLFFKKCTGYLMRYLMLLTLN